MTHVIKTYSNQRFTITDNPFVLDSLTREFCERQDALETIEPDPFAELPLQSAIYAAI